MLSGGSLHTPQSLMSRPRSWQSNGHSVSGEIKLLIGFLKISWLYNLYCVYGWVATVKMVMISSLGVRMLDRLHHYYWHPTSNQNFMMFTHNHQPIPGLYHYRHQFPCGCLSLRGWKRIILANIPLPPTSKDTADPVLCPCVPLMGWGWPPFRADIINGQPGAQA